MIACTNIIQDKREDDAKRAIALRNRAFRYQQLGDFTAAIALNPRDALAYQYRGAAYTEKNDMRRANLDAAAAIAINPTPR